MKNVWTVVGGGVFLVLTIQNLTVYGKEWEFGRYGMPVSMLAEDGCHYRDGAEVDPITLAIVRSGLEEMVEFVLTVALVTMIGFIGWSCVKFSRATKRHLRLKALLDTVREYQHAGRWKEAEEALRYFEKLTGRR